MLDGGIVLVDHRADGGMVLVDHQIRKPISFGQTLKLQICGDPAWSILPPGIRTLFPTA